MNISDIDSVDDNVIDFNISQYGSNDIDSNLSVNNYDEDIY